MINKILNTNTITLSRALLALGILLTLLFTNTSDLFPQDNIENLSKHPSELMKLNYFTWFNGDVFYAHLFSIFILFIVISGFYPRIMCIFHAWVNFSVFNSMLIIEGGDQISLVLSVLLIPICLADKRKNGWKNKTIDYNRNSLLYINSKWTLLFIQIQIAILYFNAGTAKMYAPEWSNGTAVYYWFNDNVFGALPTFKYFFGFLFENKITVSFINWGSIILEIFIFVAIFLKQKIKYLIFIPAILFHFTIIIIHGLPTFFIAMSATLILYLWRLDISIKENIVNIKTIIKLSFDKAKNNFSQYELSR